MTKEECYRVLEVSPNATDDEVRRSYLRLSKKYHPDINPNGKSKFQQITEAYEHITNKTFTNQTFTNNGYSGYRKYADKSSYNDYEHRQERGFKILQTLIVLLRLFKMFIVKSKNSKTSIIGAVIGVLYTIFIVIKPLIVELILDAKFVIVNVFYILQRVAIILAWTMTLMLVNAANTIATICVLMYKLTINPTVQIIKVPGKLIGPFVKELKPLILIAIALSIFIKIRDSDDKNKANIFITSTIILMIVVYCDIFN